MSYYQSRNCGKRTPSLSSEIVSSFRLKNCFSKSLLTENEKLDERSFDETQKKIATAAVIFV